MDMVIRVLPVVTRYAVNRSTRICHRCGCRRANLLHGAGLSETAREQNQQEYRRDRAPSA